MKISFFLGHISLMATTVCAQLVQHTWAIKWKQNGNPLRRIISTCSDAILDTIIQFLSVAAELIDVISNNVIIVPGNLSNALCRQLCAHITETSWYEIAVAVQVNLTALVSRIPFRFEPRRAGQVLTFACQWQLIRTSQVSCSLSLSL